MDFESVGIFLFGYLVWIYWISSMDIWFFNYGYIELHNDGGLIQALSLICRQVLSVF